MTNDTNKNEPYSVFESLQNNYNPDTKLFHRQWTVEEGIWVLVEIERLRDKVRLYEKYCAEQEDKGAYIEHSGWLRQERRRTNG